MMGYLKDPEGTENAYIQWNGERYFRTGDWGRIDDAGLVYFIERIKNTIIRKGNNIFPMEIETVIRTVEGVSEVCVIGLSDPAKQTEMVCACVVPNDRVNVAVLMKNIEAECKRTLPPISWPARYVFLEELPKNHMAKINRKTLEQLIV
jgi:acyl-CoA synthetase (AMP-forming)/AMP-acid ligase II